MLIETQSYTLTDRQSSKVSVINADKIVNKGSQDESELLLNLEIVFINSFNSNAS